MVELKSPENYNAMLEQLNKITLISTFLFFSFMTIYGYIPVVEISKELLPKGDIGDVWIKWAISLGLVPVTFSLIAFLASFSLEMHNLISKLIGLRILWDRKIAAKALELSQVQRDMSFSMARQFMRQEYYKGVEALSNKHYEKLFWRYTLSFWAIFEHFIVAATTVLYLWVFKNERFDELLTLYLVALFLLLMFSWYVVVLPKSYAQVRQLERAKLVDFFRTFT